MSIVTHLLTEPELLVRNDGQEMLMCTVNFIQTEMIPTQCLLSLLPHYFIRHIIIFVENIVSKNTEKMLVQKEKI